MVPVLGALFFAVLIYIWTQWSSMDKKDLVAAFLLGALLSGITMPFILNSTSTITNTLDGMAR